MSKDLSYAAVMARRPEIMKNSAGLDFSKFERVRKFQFLIKPFSLESGELTPKLSIRRHVVEKNYSELIESIYGK